MVNRRRFPTTFHDSKPAVSEMDPLQRSELQARIGSVVEGQGLWCEEVMVGGQPGDRVLSVVIDRIDNEHGVSLDSISLITQEVSAALDAEGDDIPELGAEPYTLEVSTPGTDRPLVRKHHWEKNLGRTVEVSIDEAAVKEAKIMSVDADGVELALITPGAKKGMPAKMGKPAHYAFGQLGHAVVQVQLK